MIFRLENAELIWDFDPKNTNAALIPDNYLKLVKDSGAYETLWNMRDTVGYDDCCVAAGILSENGFYFITFMGLRFTMRFDGNAVTCINTAITK